MVVKDVSSPQSCWNTIGFDASPVSRVLKCRTISAKVRMLRAKESAPHGIPTCLHAATKPVFKSWSKMTTPKWPPVLVSLSSLAEGCETAKHDSVQPDFVCFSTSCLPCRRKNLKLLRSNGAHLSADSLRTGQLRERFVTCTGNRDPLEICHILSIWMCLKMGYTLHYGHFKIILRGKMDDKPVDYRGSPIFRHMCSPRFCYYTWCSSQSEASPGGVWRLGTYILWPVWRSVVNPGQSNGNHQWFSNCTILFHFWWSQDSISISCICIESTKANRIDTHTSDTHKHAWFCTWGVPG